MASRPEKKSPRVGKHLISFLTLGNLGLLWRLGVTSYHITQILTEVVAEPHTIDSPHVIFHCTRFTNEKRNFNDPLKINMCSECITGKLLLLKKNRLEVTCAIGKI